MEAECSGGNDSPPAPPQGKRKGLGRASLDPSPFACKGVGMGVFPAPSPAPLQHSKTGRFPSISPTRLFGATRRKAESEIDGESAKPPTTALPAPLGSALAGRCARRACGVQRAHALWRGAGAAPLPHPC